MNKNIGKDYELLTQKLYQQLLDYENPEYRKCAVQHDIQIIGKSGVEHQIDVYWEFKYAGVLYKTVLEVKDWSSKVKKEQIMGFKAKLDDISGFPIGIFVSRGGFQKGAIEFARAHGIKLVSIDETHTMNHLVVKYHFKWPHVEHLSIILDKEWLTSEKQAIGITDEVKISLRAAEAILQNESGVEKPLIDFVRESQKPYINCDAGTTTHIVYKFENNWYLRTEDARLTKALIRGFEFDFHITESEEAKEFHPDWAADYILNDIIDGTQTKFNSVHGVIS